jgi:hypothetical protein
MKNIFASIIMILALFVASASIAQVPPPPGDPDCDPDMYGFYFAAPTSASAGSNFNVSLSESISVAVPSGNWQLQISQSGGDISCFINGTQYGWGSGTIQYNFSTPAYAQGVNGVYNIQLRFTKRYSGSNTVSLHMVPQSSNMCVNPAAQNVTITKP